MAEVNDIKADFDAENICGASEVRKLLESHHVRLINLMASPGAGKTSLLEQTIDRLKSQYRIAVIAADADADSDVKRIGVHGVKAAAFHLGDSETMDSGAVLKALQLLDLDGLDLVFIENADSQICQSDPDNGSDLKVMILSVPEGDDKPLKAPRMFEIVDCLLINKIDRNEIFDFNLQKLREYVDPLNQTIQVIPISAFTGSGIENWLIYLREKLIGWNRTF